MPKSLIIVESPAKTRTLHSFLGDSYEIMASNGHVRDLPKRRLGVDVEHDFVPAYEAIPDRRDLLQRLASAARRAANVYLASDPDREGEAIAWHLAEALHLTDARRIQFNEITRAAVLGALEHPRDLDLKRVDAQQARRVLDRLIGYKLSPILSSKIQRGLSAGRVQSVAVRLICDREREIQAFEPQEYWTLTANLTPQPPVDPFPFPAKLHSRAGERVEPKSRGDIDVVLGAIDGAVWRVDDVKVREQKRNAPAPFITSTLQQEAARKLGFSNKRTMAVAQSLYEGLDLGADGHVGLITYMRTDSVRVAAEAQAEARAFITERYGAVYVPAAVRQYKSRASAQDAHEAIRPTSAFRTPADMDRRLDNDQQRLYRLIWLRFVASQMNPARLDVTTADVAATTAASAGHPYVFRATGSIVRFDGFMRVYTEGRDTDEERDEDKAPLPPLTVGQLLDLLSLEPKQHFTEPPPRYTEATLVRAMEEKGIGRPSTYAATISIIQDRGYAELREKRFYPTELGTTVIDQLVKHFPTVVDIGFTAAMETHLDEVEEGTANWVTLVRDFYQPFAESIAEAKINMENQKPPPVETDYVCPATGAKMLLRKGRYGAFLGCSNYPKCRKLLQINEAGEPLDGPNFACGMEKDQSAPALPANATAHTCPDGRGVMVVRQSRYGPFLGCSNYPKCRTALKIREDQSLEPDQEFKCKWGQKAARRTSSRAGKPPARPRTGGAS
ncbi:MAG: type I DNA topoisomerase [Armatimonadetes bacterium]|nr:type I DNA topoisomerase [Armatimonadota bacterium]MDE2206060.1 type I DNA topoisomerase [Armatimonadota bacterium]